MRAVGILVQFPFPPPNQPVITWHISHSGLSCSSRKRLDGASPRTSAGSGEGELRSSSMSQTTSKHIRPHVLPLSPPLLPLGRAATVGEEVAAVAEVDAGREDTVAAGSTSPMWSHLTARTRGRAWRPFSGRSLSQGATRAAPNRIVRSPWRSVLETSGQTRGAGEGAGEGRQLDGCQMTRGASRSPPFSCAGCS